MKIENVQYLQNPVWNWLVPLRLKTCVSDVKSLKNAFWCILCFNGIHQDRKKTKSGACATHLGTPRLKIMRFSKIGILATASAIRNKKCCMDISFISTLYFHTNDWAWKPWKSIQYLQNQVCNWLVPFRLKTCVSDVKSLKDDFGCVLCFNGIYQNREKTKSGACATHLAAPRFKIHAVFKKCKFSKRARIT